jgi:hypothetical protein
MTMIRPHRREWTVESERRRVSVPEREMLNLVWTGEGAAESDCAALKRVWSLPPGVSPVLSSCSFPEANTPPAAAI